MSHIKVLGIRKHPDCDFVLDVCYDHSLKFEVQATKIQTNERTWFEYFCFHLPAYTSLFYEIPWEEVWNECEKARKNIIEAISL